MKKIRRPFRSSSLAALSALALVLGGSGCGSSEPPPPPPVKDTVFGDMVGAKDKAKADTQKALDANQKKLEETMKKQEQGTAE